jgi:hypothetical protein
VDAAAVMPKMHMIVITSVSKTGKSRLRFVRFMLCSFYKILLTKYILNYWGENVKIQSNQKSGHAFV